MKTGGKMLHWPQANKKGGGPIIPISSAGFQPATAPAVRNTERAGEARPISQTASKSLLKPARDEYVPEEKRESCGRYWLGKDGDGSPKIFFDGPEAVGEAPAYPEASQKEDLDGGEAPAVPGKKAPAGRDRKEERCICDTGKVDREIEKWKAKRAELEKRLSSETEEAKKEELKRKLSQVENELRQKDNDTYRRQHSTFTEG